MVYQTSSGRTWKLRVTNRAGVAVVLSTGFTEKEDADDVETMIRRFRGERGERHARHDVIDLLVKKVKGFTLRAVFDAHHEGTLDALVSKAKKRAASVDLRPHIAPWHASKLASRKGAKSVDKYRRQVEILFDGRPLTTETFTRPTLTQLLDELDVQDPTRNRYKAAVSSFGKYLLRAGVLETNPVRDIEGWSEGEKRTLFYERPQAKQVIGALAQPFAAIEALMCGAGLEWQAVERLRARDVNEAAGEVFARGTKYRTRTRTARVLRDNAWVWPFIRPALAGKVGDALLFDGITEPVALRRHKAACKAVGATVTTLHDWRHTHGVQGLRDGYSPAAIAHNLGHANAYQLLIRYGVFAPGALDYVPDAMRATRKDADGPDGAATDSATGVRNHLRSADA
jgi:integrase